MGVINRGIAKRYSITTGASLENPANWSSMFKFLGSQTAAGISITEQSALTNLDVLTCVSIISSALAALPLPVYRRLPNGGKERARKHPLYRLLQDQANPEMTSFMFRETLQAHLLTWGNAYAVVERDAINDPLALWPLLPDRTYAFRRDGELYYYSRIEKEANGSQTGRTFPARDVMHLRGLGFNGLTGYSVIGYMAEAIGTAVAQEQYAARFYSNNAQPPAFITTGRAMNPDEIKALAATWNSGHKGVDKAWQIGVLEQGMDIKSIGMPLQDAQFLETRKYNSAKIAGFFRVPPDMLGDPEKSGPYGVGIEQRQIGFVTFTLQPWATRWEQQINKDLLLRVRDQDYFAEFLLDALKRGDLTSRGNYYNQGWGKWLTTDDIRDLENQNPYTPPTDPKDVGKVLVWQQGFANAEDIATGKTLASKNPPPVSGGPGGNPDQSASRRRHILAQRAAFSAIADRIIRREIADLARMKKRTDATLDAFYDDHRDYIKKNFGPSLRSFAQTIAADVSAELGRDVDVPESFVEKYIDGYAQRHVAASLSEMRDLVGSKNIEESLASWATRPDWIASREAAQAGNAFARAAYRDAGVMTVEWRSGDDCQDCVGLHGRAVPIDGVFASRGDLSDDRYVPANGLGHPPLCDGCGCVIVASDGSARERPASDRPLVVTVSPTINVPDRPIDRTAADVGREVERLKRDQEEEMREFGKDLSDGLAKLADAVAKQGERPIVVNVDMPKQDPAVVNVTVPEQPAPTIRVAAPKVEIPPITVNVEGDSETELEYDRQGTLVRSRTRRVKK